jgi:carboxyl-terminal processing protease
MKEFFKTKRNYSTILLIVLFFILGVYVGNGQQPEIDKITSLINKETGVETQADFGPFWKAWNEINEKSPNANKITDQERVYGAISGLVSSLDDPYSVFFSPDEAKAFQEEIAGNFTGVGMEIGVKNKTLTVVAPLKNTPAERAGILSGDQILQIDDTITSGISVDEAVKLIRGERGTIVTLIIFRDGFKEPKEIKITRDIIEIPTLDEELRSDGIFVIRLYSFSANATSLFSQAMQRFIVSDSNKLLLDLRGNPGGYLDAAIDISSWFLPGGKIVVTEDYGENQKPRVFRSRGYGGVKSDLKFVILINGGSASASEIVAGAMQDHKRATLVGTQSFGKGSVQEVVDITKNTLLKITVANWLTPNGHLIHEKGLTPDYKVEFTLKDLEAKRDPQMDKAVKLLLNE